MIFPGKSLTLGFQTEDEKVSTDELQEKIAEFEDYVQSTDITAMQSKLSFSYFQCTRLFRPPTEL